MTERLSPQPFDAFIESVAHATYDDFRRLPGSEVESAAAFEEMRAYLLEEYRDVTVETSLVEDDGQVIDCIPEELHPAMRRSYGGVTAKPPAAPPEPETYDESPPPFITPGTGTVLGALPRTRHGDGTETGQRYPAGTLPRPRTTLEQLARFPSLDAFAAKEPVVEAGASGVGAAATALATEQRYATGEQAVACLGGSAYLNVWKPFLMSHVQWTFSQLWFRAIRDGTFLQTVECGWHIDPGRYGDVEPHLFVFTTTRNYDTGTNFYNQEGGLFLPASNAPALPGARLFASQQNGTQVEYRMAFYLTAGAWWFYLNDRPVGRYPLSVFGDGPLAHGATKMTLGGEVHKAIVFSTWGPMGSGAPASAGWSRAAYHRAALVYPPGGGAVSPTLSDAGSVTGSCYSVAITNNSPTAWGTYLYAGGPGGVGC